MQKRHRSRADVDFSKTDLQRAILRLIFREDFNGGLLASSNSLGDTAVPPQPLNRCGVPTASGQVMARMHVRHAITRASDLGCGMLGKIGGLSPFRSG
jgi:hypothetical protein